MLRPKDMFQAENRFPLFRTMLWVLCCRILCAENRFPLFRTML